MNRRIFCHTLLTLFVSLGLAVPSQALEMGVDGAFSGSTQLDDWGASSHLQLIGNNGLGLDVGYQYLNSISYNALNTSLTHAMSQYEVGLLWQTGDKAFRLQALAGGVFSANWIQSGVQDVITSYSPGYNIGIGLSVPLFTRFRLFADGGYQGWLDAEIPNHLRWRYGVRMTFGQGSSQKLAVQEQAELDAETAQQQAALENPPVTINADVPEFIPRDLSQSLPPIVERAEICRCFPAGPYTLQLGEFGSLASAVRGLEFRGLRQFFNSRAYQNRALPVFLSQGEVNGPVSLYLGEFATVDELQYWRHELRKSGISARFRKILGSNGQRVANQIVAMDEEENAAKPKYTAEQISQMNSLPDDEMPKDQPTEDYTEIQAQQDEMDAENATLRIELNKPPLDPKPAMIGVLQVGPLPLQRLQSLLDSRPMKDVLSRRSYIQIPQRMELMWDEGRKEAWVSFRGFSSEQHVDEWFAWFQSEGIAATQVSQPFEPIGDVYFFLLGQALEEFSVELERRTDIGSMIQVMRSPEVLWFQAYQRINEQPVLTSLNWSETDERYHLIVTNVNSPEEQQQIWSDLTAVGLLPSLAEE